MTEADRTAVGLVGFAAWTSSNAFEGAYLDPVVIERVRGEFETFAAETQCDVVIAEIDGALAGWGEGRCVLPSLFLRPLQGKGNHTHQPHAEALWPKGKASKHPLRALPQARNPRPSRPLRGTSG